MNNLIYWIPTIYIVIGILFAIQVWHDITYDAGTKKQFKEGVKKVSDVAGFDCTNLFLYVVIIGMAIFWFAHLATLCLLTLTQLIKNK